MFILFFRVIIFYMKKFLSYLIIFLTGSLLFAKQPFFLENWIVPEDFEWGTGNKLPEIPGAFIYQFMFPEAENPSISFLEKEKSNVDFPPYFIENNLISWDKNYAEILSAFDENQLFFTYTYTSPALKNDNPSDAIEFNDVIRIICRQDNYFEIELQFPHARNPEERNKKKPGFCSIYCHKNGLDKSKHNLLPKEIFEKEYKAEWEAYSPDERKILALSYFLLRDNDYLPANYNCTLSIHNTHRDPADKLKKTFSINNRKELLDSINNQDNLAGVKSYKDFCKLLASNPDKKILELAEENRYTVSAVSKLFFIDTMREFIDENLLDAFLKARALLFLRYGNGAGYISREESVELAKPIVEQILKQYHSYEDFAAHIALGQSYLGLSDSTYAKMPLDIMKSWNEAEQYISIEDLHFDGSQAAKPLAFEDAYYKPQGQALWWTKVQKEYNNHDGQELSAIKEGMAKYGTALCLRNLIKAIKPKKYDSKSGEKAEDFFNNNYKDIWNKLPENEKYAIAFSSNLFELNDEYHLDFEGKVAFSGYPIDCIKLLSGSWDVENHDDLVETFKDLEASGHSGAYQRLCDILDKHPGQDVFEIAEEEGLSIMETCRLCFVNDTRELTGPHGIEAWDEGREITILRWGIASGYITSEEAMELIEPVLKRIRQNYISFEDYICHYIIGRQFFGLYEGNYEMRGVTARDACPTAAAYIPFDDLVFTAENADKTKAMTYSNCTYKPSAAFLKWERVMKLYRKDSSESVIAEVEQLEEELPEFKKLLFSWQLSLLYECGKNQELIKFTEDNMNLLESFPKNEMTYSDSIYMYVSGLNNTYQPLKAIQVFADAAEQEGFQLTTYLFYQYGYANYLMMNLCASQYEFESYKQTAIGTFSILEQYNYDMPGLIANWLETVH